MNESVKDWFIFRLPVPYWGMDTIISLLTFLFLFLVHVLALATNHIFFLSLFIQLSPSGSLISYFLWPQTPLPLFCLLLSIFIPNAFRTNYFFSFFSPVEYGVRGRTFCFYIHWDHMTWLYKLKKKKHSFEFIHVNTTCFLLSILFSIMGIIIIRKRVI